MKSFNLLYEALNFIYPPDFKKHYKSDGSSIVFLMIDFSDIYRNNTQIKSE